MRILAVLALATALGGCAFIAGPAPASAQTVLEHWADFVAEMPADTIVFVQDLTQGGGWDGDNADDAKIAFISGALEATVELPDQEPPPGQVVWSGGTHEQVALISAAAAFAGMIAEQRAAGGNCDGCRALQVTGAELMMHSATTSHGDASVPVWQFEFAPGDQPMESISYVAVNDLVAPRDWPRWGNQTPMTEAAYGTAGDTRITVSFIGGACDTSHSIVAAESPLAIVPIITTAANQGPCTAQGVRYGLVMQLAAPLGNRVVLDLDTGFPVAVYPEEPPALQPG